MSTASQASILLLGAKSTGKPLDSVPRELNAIKQLFNDKTSQLRSLQPGFQLEYEPYFTQDGLKKLLDRLADQVAILHFAGHSDADGLQTDDKIVYSKHIAGIIKSWSIKPTLVFLNGCQNQQQVRLFLDVGVTNIIATHRPISDRQASSFAFEFYTSLFNSNATLALQTAFKQAGEKVFLDKAGQSRSLDNDTLDQTDSDNWDWGLFGQDSNARQWTLQQLLTEDRPRLDRNGKLINPYKGLEAFKEEDQVWFFGREALSEELTKAIQTSRFFTLLSASGSGKSSLINAAVIPKLRQLDSGNQTSLILKTNPANAPFAELVNVICEYLYPDNLAQRLTEQKTLSKQLQKQQISLTDLLKSLLQKNGKSRLYLCIDQFEELFTQSQTPIVQGFIAELIALIQSDINCCLILIMRADFLSSALANTEFTELLDKHPPKLLAPMSKAELREAIEKPASKQRIQIEASLLEALLDDIKDQSGYLPLLQYTLSLLWEKRQGNKIRLADYTALGGLKKVLETRANEIYQSFSKQQKAHCKQIFLRLIQPGEGTEDTRRRATLDEFDQQNKELQATIKTLADARLITTQQSNKSKQAYAEISHEALIKYWPQLREWIAENREELRTQHQISAGAKDWKQHDFDTAWLLSGSRLLIAEEWLNKNAVRATELEKEFIQKAIEERDRQAKAKEKQRKRNRNVLVGFLAMITVIALFALTQWQSAKEKTVIAEQAKDDAVKAKNKTDEKILESNFFLAKSYEQKALLALEKGDQAQQKGRDKSITEYQKAWLYAFEAEKLPLSKDKAALKLDSLVKLTNLSAQAISPGIYQTPSFLNIGSSINAIAYNSTGKILASASSDKSLRLWDTHNGELKKTIKGHNGRINSVAFSPDGKLLASASSDRTLRLWNVKTGNHKRTLKGHKGSIKSVVFSHDNRWLASASSDKTIRLWNAKTGEYKQTLEGHKGSVNSIVFSPDSRWLVSASSDKKLRVWDSNTWELERIFEAHKRGINSVAFSPDGKWLTSVSSDRTLKVWDSNTWELKKILNKQKSRIYSISFSPDGKWLASGSSDKTIRLWDTKTWEHKQILNGHKGRINSVTFNPDGKLLTSASSDKTIRLWDTKTWGHKQILNGHKGRINSVAFSSDGKWLASASSDKTIRLWDTKTGKLLQTFLGHNQINSCALSPDNKWLVSASSDNSLIVWNTKTGKLQRTLTRHKDQINSVAFSLDGRWLASASSDRTLKLWDAKTWEFKRTFEGHKDRINSVAFGIDSKMIVSASSDNTLRLFDVKSGNLIKTFEVQARNVNSVSFSPDGRMLTSTLFDLVINNNIIQLWDIKSGELKKIFRGHIESVNSVSFDPHGNMLASASNDKTLRLWNLKTGELKQTFKGHSHSVKAVAFSPADKILASVSNDETLRLWDTNTGGLKQTLKRGSWSVNAITFSPDGKMLVSASGDVLTNDKNLRLWNIHTGQLIKTFSGHTSNIHLVSFSPDGKILASASGDDRTNDNTIRLWNVTMGKPIHTPMKYNSIVLNIAFSPDNQLFVSVSGDVLIDDYTLQFWNTKTGKLENTFNKNTGRISSIVFSPNGKWLVSVTFNNFLTLWNTKTGKFQKTFKERTKSISFSSGEDVLTLTSFDGSQKVWNIKTDKPTQIVNNQDGAIPINFNSGGKLLVYPSLENILQYRNVNSSELKKIVEKDISSSSSVTSSTNDKIFASISSKGDIRIWNKNQFTTLKLFYEFDPKQVSDALQFLWEMGLDKDKLEFVHKARKPSLYPKQGYYYQDVQYRPLLDMPREDESKMDQLVRFLEVRCAYKDKARAEACEKKK